MSALPPGWEWDYDGERWFYRYTPTGLVQFQFPKIGDEFPDHVDPNSPAPNLAPEEKLQSQRQVKRNTPAGLTSSTLPGPDDDFDYIPPEALMYLGPGGYDDISPVQDGDGKPWAFVPIGIQQGKATTDATPIAEVDQKSKQTAAGSLKDDGSASRGTEHDVGQPISSQPAVAGQPSAPKTTFTQSNQHDDRVDLLLPAIPLPNTRHLLHELPASTDPKLSQPVSKADQQLVAVGFVAEMPTEFTGLCDWEVNPPAVELADTEVMQTRGRARSDPVKPAELPENVATTDHQNAPSLRQRQLLPTPSNLPQHGQTVLQSPDRNPRADPAVYQPFNPQTSPSGRYRSHSTVSNVDAIQIQNQELHSGTTTRPAASRGDPVPSVLLPARQPHNQPSNNLQVPLSALRPGLGARHESFTAPSGEHPIVHDPAVQRGLGHVPSVLKPARGRGSTLPGQPVPVAQPSPGMSMQTVYLPFRLVQPDRNVHVASGEAPAVIAMPYLSPVPPSLVPGLIQVKDRNLPPGFMAMSTFLAPPFPNEPQTLSDEVSSYGTQSQASAPYPGPVARGMSRPGSDVGLMPPLTGQSQPQNVNSRFPSPDQTPGVPGRGPLSTVRMTPPTADVPEPKRVSMDSAARPPTKSIQARRNTYQPSQGSAPFFFLSPPRDGSATPPQTLPHKASGLRPRMSASAPGTPSRARSPSATPEGSVKHVLKDDKNRSHTIVSDRMQSENDRDKEVQQGTTTSNQSSGSDKTTGKNVVRLESDTPAHTSQTASSATREAKGGLNLSPSAMLPSPLHSGRPSLSISVVSTESTENISDQAAPSGEATGASEAWKDQHPNPLQSNPIHAKTGKTSDARKSLQVPAASGKSSRPVSWSVESLMALHQFLPPVTTAPSAHQHPPLGNAAKAPLGGDLTLPIVCRKEARETRAVSMTEPTGQPLEPSPPKPGMSTGLLVVPQPDAAPQQWSSQQQQSEIGHQSPQPWVRENSAKKQRHHSIQVLPRPDAQDQVPRFFEAVQKTTPVPDMFQQEQLDTQQHAVQQPQDKDFVVYGQSTTTQSNFARSSTPTSQSSKELKRRWFNKIFKPKIFRKRASLPNGPLPGPPGGPVYEDNTGLSNMFNVTQPDVDLLRNVPLDDLQQQEAEPDWVTPPPQEQTPFFSSQEGGNEMSPPPLPQRPAVPHIATAPPSVPLVIPPLHSMAMQLRSPASPAPPLPVRRRRSAYGEANMESDNISIAPSLLASPGQTPVPMFAEVQPMLRPHLVSVRKGSQHFISPPPALPAGSPPPALYRYAW